MELKPTKHIVVNYNLTIIIIEMIDKTIQKIEVTIVLIFCMLIYFFLMKMEFFLNHLINGRLIRILLSEDISNFHYLD